MVNFYQFDIKISKKENQKEIHIHLKVNYENIQ